MAQTGVSPIRRFGVHEPMAIEFEGETYQVTAEVVEED